MKQPGLDIHIHQLENYIRSKHELSGTLDRLTITPLEGGYVASGVYRIDLTFQTDDSHYETYTLVQKQTTANEVRVMQLLQSFDLPELPALIDYYIDSTQLEVNGASWFVSPYYDATALTFDDEIPLSIVNALATIHAQFVTRADEFDWLPRVNDTFITHLLTYVSQCLVDSQSRLPDSLVTEVKSLLESMGSSPTLTGALSRLPLTLTHGDVHPGNILQISEDEHVLFDWGNARLAPAMLDLANTVDMDTPPWQQYLKIWESQTGKSLDKQLALLGYTWASAIVNLQYLPFAMGNLDPDNVQTMIDKVQAAITTLEEML